MALLAKEGVATGRGGRNDDPVRLSGARRGRRWLRWVAACIGVAVVAGTVAGVLRRSGDGNATSGGTAAVSTSTAGVERRDLIEEESFEGTLSYDDAFTLNGGLSGTVTSMQSEGALVARGQPLFEVDEQPVTLLYGTKPAYRSLQDGVEDGRDVRQLERNLVAMGYDPNGYIDIDEEFDWATTDAIEDWQEDRGMSEDGIVDLGEVVFSPGRVRIGAHQANVGSAASQGTPVMDVSSSKRVVTMKTPVDQRGLLQRGMEVDVELPDGRTISGRVRSIGRVAEGGSEEEDPTVEVKVALRSDKGLGRFDQTPVTVNVAAEVAKDVLSVPVSALLALAEGGYALEVMDGPNRKLVGVDTGMYADGYVEIEGRGINEGTEVVVPE